MEDIEMTSKKFEEMINEAKEGNLEQILKVKKIMENNFETIKFGSEKFEIKDSQTFKKLEKDYCKFNDLFSDYEKSIENYWQYIKKIYLPMIKDNEKRMRN